MTGKVHRLLRGLVYNSWIENIFYPRGVSKQINDETIKVPYRFHKFYPSVYEPEKTDFIKQHCRPGSTAIDIGAHMGIFSFFLARQVGGQGKVYSFEPSPFTFSVLKKTISLNGLGAVIQPRQQVVSGTHGHVTFYIHTGSSISYANSISAQNISDGHTRPITVPAMLLDDFMDDSNFKDLSFIKIDAEGAELEILKGGTRLIRKYRPYMTLEVHPQSFDDAAATQKELYMLLTELGYRLYRNKKPVTANEFCAMSDCFEVMLLPA